MKVGEFGSKTVFNQIAYENHYSRQKIFFLLCFIANTTWAE
jgi:hypothetical protein